MATLPPVVVSVKDCPFETLAHLQMTLPSPHSAVGWKGNETGSNPERLPMTYFRNSW